MNVSCAIFYRENKILLCRRPLHKDHGGLWEFPGGKWEPLEDPEQALRRELSEELRLFSLTTSPLGVVTSPPIRLHSFLCQTHEPIIPLEHIAYAWVKYSELSHFSLCPGDLKTTTEFQKSIKDKLFKAP